MRTPRQGPTPVGDRLRASTIPAKKHPGPSADEWEAECLHLERLVPGYYWYCVECGEHWMVP